MEQITLTKEELKEIIAKEVRNAIKGEKPISSGAIFSKVRINNDDLEEINKKTQFRKRFVARKIEEAQSSDSAKKVSAWLRINSSKSLCTRCSWPY